MEMTTTIPAAEVLATDRSPTPRSLERPAFLMNPPFSYATGEANNVWMRELDEAERRPDFPRAMAQFLEVYRFLASSGVVYLIPDPPDQSLQDLVFAGNLGVVLEHPEEDVVVLSNFTTEVRRGETEVGLRFFENTGFAPFVSPSKFEGDAELKHLHDTVYVGGYGQRSERESYEWMEREFDMDVVKLAHDDEYLYHLDCTVFPLTREKTLVCTELYDKEEVAELDRHTEIIDVPLDACYAGICNSVRLDNLILNSSHIHEIKAGTEDYDSERDKNHLLEKIASDNALEVNYFNLSEYHKGGALLSCMVMHLNRYSYAFSLL